MKNLRIREIVRFENFLWEHQNPAECLEDWAWETTEAIKKLSSVSGIPMTQIALPLSSMTYSWVKEMHDFLRTPVSERGENESILDFYSGAELTDDELLWVANHIQSDIIPAF